MFPSRSQWPRGLRRRSAAARLLRLWVRIPPVAWMFVRCECCVFSGRDLCDELITLPEESYRLWCVVVCDLETSWMRRPWSTLGSSLTKKEKIFAKRRSFLNPLETKCDTLKAWQRHKYCQNTVWKKSDNTKINQANTRKFCQEMLIQIHKFKEISQGREVDLWVWTE